ncbi:MAG: hypothetical protein LPK12_05895 [Rhodobacterales bacterium]|nr:hypothetical protein [Rhodobacterales bacterium]MDX5499510.1 hypothetical protein [Rhodobacterales bacterium]
MRKSLMAALAAVMVVTGCASVRESRLNPFNWFGRSEKAAAVAAEPVRDEGRVPVAQVTELFVEPTVGGAIIRAKGLPPTQGWYAAELIQEEVDKPGELVFRFVLKQPAAAVSGTPMSREVTVATFVSDFKLEGVRTITVTGSDNARTTRRR